jgi:glycerophosphoryl diester phosphodiesterase
MKDWPYPSIFAHRGGGSLAPENTLAAIRTGQSLGYAGQELDVKLTKDAIAMLLHDDTLERTTSGKGRAADLTWKELLELDAGRWHSKPFAGERLVSFEDAAKLLRSKGTRANVEIKPSKGFERETGKRVAESALELWKGDEVPPLLSSFSFDALMAAKQAAPSLPRGWLVEKFTEDDWSRLEELEAASLHTDYRKLGEDDIDRLHEEGYRILVYTVNHSGTAQQLLDAGVDGLFTDNLADFARRFPEAIRVEPT